MKQFGQRFNAYQTFLLGCKTFWIEDLYTQVNAEAEAGLKGNPQIGETDVDDALQDSIAYKYYAWLERHLQKMKYSGR